MKLRTLPCILAASFCCAAPALAPALASDTVTINFDSLDAVNGPVHPMVFLSYLGQFGILSFGWSIGSMPYVVDVRQQWPHGEVWATSRYNVLTSFTGGTPSVMIFQFGRELSSFSFTRPTFGSLPGETTIHPAWRLTAFDQTWRDIGFVEQDLTIAVSGVPAQTFHLEAPGISRVMFSSDPMGIATIDAVLIDSMVLTYAAPTPGCVLLLAVGVAFASRRQRVAINSDT
jgi:hypothetical protein